MCLNWNPSRFPLALPANSVYYASLWEERSGSSDAGCLTSSLNVLENDQFIECLPPKVCHVTKVTYILPQISVVCGKHRTHSMSFTTWATFLFIILSEQQKACCLIYKSAFSVGKCRLLCLIASLIRWGLGHHCKSIMILVRLTCCQNRNTQLKKQIQPLTLSIRHANTKSQLRTSATSKRHSSLSGKLMV